MPTLPLLVLVRLSVHTKLYPGHLHTKLYPGNSKLTLLDEILEFK